MKDEALKEHTLDSTRVFRGHIFDVEKRRVKLPNGAEAQREVVMHPGAVCVIALTEEGTVPLVRQWRSGYGGITLELPAGKLDAGGEDPLSAAKRELREETGLVAREWISLGEFYGSPAILDEKIYMYLARDLTRGEAEPDADEFLEVGYYPLEALVEMALSGELPDGKTQCGVLRLSKMPENK